MLASKNLRVALVTTHISLNKVAKSITLKKIRANFNTLKNDLGKKI
jgi:4-hydroxy-L-threonine phosphate dehydrogenase PdxA